MKVPLLLDSMINLRPYSVFLFALAVLAVLGSVSYFTPKEGWHIGNAQLNFISWQKVQNPKPAAKKDISRFIAKVDTVLQEEIADTLLQHENAEGNLGKPKGGAIFSKESQTQIYLSDAGRANLYRFFEQLQSVADKNDKITILHYGDSQIEGDRMTAYIRQRIQEQFGGNGPGMIPTVNVYQTMSFKQTCSPEFMRYTVFGGDKLKSRKYGSMGSAGRFTLEPIDSNARAHMTEVKNAWIEIEPSKSAYSRSRIYNNVIMHYTSCNAPCGLKVYRNGSLIHEDSLIMDGKYHNLPLTFEGSAGKLKYEFSASISPTILGFALEGDLGVQVDNIAMRGSSGTIFGHMDQSLVAKMYENRNVELVIMQFGGNSVPYMKDSTAARNYAKQLRGQLNTIKKMRPSAAILVIGPSDMSRMTEGNYETYPVLPTLVRMMKKYSLEAGAGYWDLFEAMGGENSMPTWVDQGLAGNDYIHFSNRGASIAAQLFYQAFAAEFAKWKTP